MEHVLEVNRERRRYELTRDGLEYKLVDGFSVCIPGRLYGILLYGFARKRDAEIARDTLEAMDIDWTLPDMELREVFDSMGGRDYFMKEVCKNLQW